MGATVFNNAATVLTGAVSSSSTTINVSDVREFVLPVGVSNWEAASSSPGTTFSIITLETVDNATREIVRLRDVSAGSGNTGTLTISRIAAASHAFSVGDKVELRISAELVTELSQDGRSLHNGTADPSSVTGALNGDFFLRTDTSSLFGPVSISGSTQTWGSGTSLIGNTGPTGLGYSNVSYSSGTGALTFTGSNGNSDVVTGSVKGDTGANITGVAVTLDNTSASGNEYDMAFTTSDGTVINVNQAILAPAGPALGVTQLLRNGVTASAPSEDVIFDALALKQDTSTFTADVRSQISTPAGSLVSYSSASGEISLSALSLHDTVVYTTKALRNADTSTTWHRGDIAILTATGVDKGSYIYIGTDMTTAGVSVDADWVVLKTPDVADTNLSYDTASRVVSSSTGTNATLPLSTTSVSGLMSSAQFDELAALAAGTIATSSSYGDNVKAVFGTGSDLEIYHSALHSFITESGTGNLRIGGDNLALQSSAHDENYVICLNGDSVTLYHNNVAKISTTATGVSVTGDLVASDDIVANGGIVEVKTNSGTAGAVRLYCEVGNAHYQTIQSQPHSASASNTMLLPTGASSTLVSLVSTDTLSNKTLATPAITGNVTMTGTLDGRNVATDGTKLDGISASADVTTAALTALGASTAAIGTDLVPVYDVSTGLWTKQTITNASIGPTFSLSGTVLTITT